MARIPKHVQAARNLHAKDVQKCECGAFVATMFMELHLRTEHNSEAKSNEN